MDLYVFPGSSTISERAHSHPDSSEYVHNSNVAVTLQDRFGSLFFQVMFLALMGLSSLPIWADDRLLFYRERTAGAYGTGAYFTAGGCSAGDVKDGCPWQAVVVHALFLQINHH